MEDMQARKATRTAVYPRAKGNLGDILRHGSSVCKAVLQRVVNTSGAGYAILITAGEMPYPRTSFLARANKAALGAAFSPR